MPKLLVVDDEPSILHFFRRAFPGPDVTLLTASSAAEGLAAVGRDRPDVVVLDIDLGARARDRRAVVFLDTDLSGESGLELFRRIHEQDPKIPVVFITGRGTAD